MNDTDIIDRKLFLYFAGIALAGGVLGGALTGRLLRTEQNVKNITEIERISKRVKRIEAVEYITVSKINAAPLPDPKQACSGAAVKVIQLDVTEAENKVKTSWILVKPVGDAYNVSCTKQGDYTGYYKVGDTVRLYGGKLDEH